MKTIFALAEQTRLETNGYFDIRHDGHVRPVRGGQRLGDLQAAEILRQNGAGNFYVDAGGDIQMAGKNGEGQNWRVGIRNPFNPDEIVKALSLTDCGVATSGTYVRGQHIYNPLDADDPLDEIVSLTVIGPRHLRGRPVRNGGVCDGKTGIFFIEALEGFDGYMIDQDQRATYTTGFQRYLLNDQIHR